MVYTPALFQTGRPVLPAGTNTLAINSWMKQNEGCMCSKLTWFTST
jgi:hypothetical protein